MDEKCYLISFDHDFYKDYLKDRIQPYKHFKNLVVSSGSGVTISVC